MIFLYAVVLYFVITFFVALKFFCKQEQLYIYYKVALEELEELESCSHKFDDKVAEVEYYHKLAVESNYLIHQCSYNWYRCWFWTWKPYKKVA
jgi:hypothetical protein